MKRQNMQDERVLAQRRKINNEAYGILMIALLTSILVQQFLLKAPLEQYAAEFICLFGVSLYIIVRNLTLGLNLYGEEKQARGIILVHGIISGTVVTILCGVANYAKYAEHYKGNNVGLFIAMLVVTFICSTALVLFILLFVNHLNKKKQAKIIKQLDQDE